MVKKCSVVLNNEAVTVVKYGDIDIQFPSIHKDDKKVFVNYEDGRYFIVDKNYKPNGASANEKKCANKKTTVEKFAKELDTAIEDSDNA